MKKEAGGANDGDEAVDKKAPDGAACLVVWPENVRDLAFVLGIFDGVRRCALCRNHVLEADGVTIVHMEEGGRVMKTPGLHLHHRCAGRLAEAIERNYAGLQTSAKQEIDRAEARIGLGHA